MCGRTSAVVILGSALLIGRPLGGATQRIVDAHSEEYPTSTASGATGTWTPAGAGLDTDNVAKVYVHPTQALTVYACGPKGSLFRSSDGAAQWNIAGLGLPAWGSISELAADQQRPELMYAVAGDALYESSNRGTTWRRIWYQEDATLSSMCVEPRQSSTLYLATRLGVLKSTDRGHTWRNASRGMDLRRYTPCVLAADTGESSTIYAGTYLARYGHKGVIYRSTNHGASWAEASAGLGSGNVLAIAIDPQVGSTLYSVTSRGGVYKSTDGGGSWQRASYGLPWAGAYDGATLAIDPENPSCIYVVGPGGIFFRSLDGGASWQQVDIRVWPAAVNSVAISPTSPSTVYVGTSGSGVRVSTDHGATWRSSNTGLQTEQVRELVTYPEGPSTLYVSVSSDDRSISRLYSSANGGDSWALTHEAPPARLAVDPRNSSMAWAVHRHDWVSALVKTEDGGHTWARGAASGLPGWVSSVLIDPTKPSTMYAGTNRWVYKSTDRGSTWTRAWADSSTKRYGFDWVDPVAIDLRHRETLYAVEYWEAPRDYGSQIFKTTDGGAHWEAASSGTLVDDEWIGPVVIDPSNSSIVYAASDWPHVYKTTDAGATWTIADRGIGSKSVEALAVDPSDTSTIYAGTSLGLFVSTDAATTWSRVRGTPSSHVTALELYQTDPAALYVGFADCGVWRWQPGAALEDRAEGTAANVEVGAGSLRR